MLRQRRFGAAVLTILFLLTPVSAIAQSSTDNETLLASLYQELIQLLQQIETLTGHTDPPTWIEQ